MFDTALNMPLPYVYSLPSVISCNFICLNFWEEKETLYAAHKPLILMLPC